MNSIILGEQQGCGGQKNVSNGPVTIQSVDLDSNRQYESMLDCQWLIGGPDYQSLEVTFETFNLEGGERIPGKNVSNPLDECPYDYVEVHIFGFVYFIMLVLCYFHFLNFFKDERRTRT